MSQEKRLTDRLKGLEEAATRATLQVSKSQTLNGGLPADWVGMPQSVWIALVTEIVDVLD